MEGQGHLGKTDTVSDGSDRGIPDPVVCLCLLEGQHVSLLIS